MPDKQQPLNDEALKMAYQQVCSSYHAIDDFRAKLLGFLPLASGAGIFLLLNDAFTDPTKCDFAKQFVVPIGIFGFVVTFGLFFYELRGVQKCQSLIAIGMWIEDELEIEGQFKRKPHPLLGFIGEPLAAPVIYSAVLAAWIFLAMVFNWPQAALWTASLFFFIMCLVGFYVLEFKAKANGKEKPNISAVLSKILKVIDPDLQADPKVADPKVKERIEKLKTRMEKLAQEQRVPAQKDWQELNELTDRLVR